MYGTMDAEDVTMVTAAGRSCQPSSPVSPLTSLPSSHDCGLTAVLFTVTVSLAFYCLPSLLPA